MFTRRTKRRPTSSRTTPVKRKPSLDFSVTGLVFCSMMMFMGLAAINSQANLLFAVFGLMIGVLLVSGLISRLVLRKLSVTRHIPESAVVGQPVTLQYHFTNEKRFWPSLSVSLAELDGSQAFITQPVAYLLHAAATLTSTVPVEVIPRRRGLHTLNHFQISTSFPFGFIKRAIERSQWDTILVYPALAKVNPRLIQMCRAADNTGPTIRPRRGGMDEFYGVKEHRTGENPRWIYWKRSAKAGTLVAKEMTQVTPPKALLLVDTRLSSRTDEEHAAVEKVIAMAASLASDALEAGLSVGLMAWANGWISLTPQRGKRHRRELLAALARLPINMSHGAQELLDESHKVSHAGTTPILLTPRDIQVGLADHLRSGMIVLSPASEMANRWFQWPREIDWAGCVPQG